MSVSVVVFHNMASSWMRTGHTWRSHSTLSWSSAKNRGQSSWKRQTFGTVQALTQSWAKKWVFEPHFGFILQIVQNIIMFTKWVSITCAVHGSEAVWEFCIFNRLIIFIRSLPVVASLLDKPLDRLIHTMSDKDTSMLTLRGSFSTVEESHQRGADELLCGGRKGKNPPCTTSPSLVLQTQLCTCAVYM